MPHLNILQSFIEFVQNNGEEKREIPLDVLERPFDTIKLIKQAQSGCETFKLD